MTFATHTSALVEAGRVERRLIRRIFAPPPKLTVSEWADRYFVIPPEWGATHGPWRTDRVPYMREVLDTLGDPLVHEVVVMAAAQVAKTSVGVVFSAFLIDQQPCPILLVVPDETFGKNFSVERLEPAFRSTPRIHRHLTWSERRNSENTILSKRFPGGLLALASARSPAQLSSRPIRVVIFDEPDRYPGVVGKEGDPMKVAGKRTTTFYNWKTYKVSTPTTEEESRIAPAYAESDRGRYVVACPYCTHEQTLDWIRDDRDEVLVPSVGITDPNQVGSYGLVCDHDAAGSPIPETARYACLGCGVLIPEEEKHKMVLRGRWVPKYPGRAARGFHVSSLISPWVRWSDLMRRFLEAKDSANGRREFDNLDLGLPFREKGLTVVDAGGLASRAEDYGAEVPVGVGVLTAFIDVQVDRIEAFVWGWGDREEGWAIEWIVIEGDPGEDEVWQKADELVLFRDWIHASGAKMRLAAMAVDSGYHAEKVYRYCEARANRRVYPTKGVPGRGRPLWTKSGPTTHKTKAKTRALVALGVDSGKDALASKLRVPAPGPHYLHFSTRLDRVFYDQLTAEELVTTINKKTRRPERVWRLRSEGLKNESTDGFVGAYGCLISLGPKVLRDLGVLAEKLTKWTPPPGDEPPPGGGGPIRRVRSQGIE